MKNESENPVVELDYADADESTGRRSRHVRRLVRFAMVAMLLIHLFLCSGAAHLHSAMYQRAGFIMAPGTTLSFIFYQMLCFFRYTWYPLWVGAALDTCVVIAIYFEARSRSGRLIQAATGAICLIAIAGLAASVLVLQALSQIRIVSTNTGGTLIAGTTEYAIFSCIIAGPASLWLTYTIIRAIQSQPPAPSPAPESSRDS